MIFNFKIIDYVDETHVASAIIDVTSIEYDFHAQAMAFCGANGDTYYKRMPVESYERMCDSFLMNADFRSGTLMNLNSLGSFIKGLPKGSSVSYEAWSRLLDKTMMQWDFSGRF